MVLDRVADRVAQFRIDVEARVYAAQIDRAFGDRHPVRIGEKTRNQRGFPGIAAEQLNHRKAFMAAGGGAQSGDEFHRTADRGGKTDAVIRAEHVIIHGLGHGHHPHAFLRQPRGIGQRIIPPNGHKGVYLQMFQHLEHLTCAINRAILVDGQFQNINMGRNFCRFDLAGIGARSVQNGAAALNDAADIQSAAVASPFVTG